MLKPNHTFRHIFLQKKLIENTQIYPYTYIFQYNNVSANDWKKIKDMIHNSQKENKMNLFILPSKIKKLLTSKNQSSFLFFSNIKGLCCILNCHKPEDLKVFYKIINQSTENLEPKNKLSIYSTSFLHLALQQNIKRNQETLSFLLNFLDIEKTVSLNKNKVYQEFFNTLNSKTFQCLFFSPMYFDQIQYMVQSKPK